MYRGKHAPTYSPSMDMGAFVVVINAEHVKVTGDKFTDKTYFSQNVTGRPGSGKIESFKDLQAVSVWAGMWRGRCVLVIGRWQLRGCFASWGG
jgi:hypothetical protein